MMMKKVMVIAIMVFFGYNVTAQEDNNATDEVVTHRVIQGETVMLISKKYLVTPQDIYELNPDAVNGITPNSSLRIPSGRKLVVKLKSVPPVKKRTYGTPGSATAANPEGVLSLGKHS